VLPRDVRVRGVGEAPEGFDARFSAVWRRYAYRIADDPAVVDPLVRRMVLTWPRPLDLEPMNRAAAELLGEHDFAAFCKKREGATTVRTLLELSWTRDDTGLVVGTVRADAFCHHMVRSLVGCLVAVGEGQRPSGWAADVLGAAKRDSAVRVVAAHGLTLEEVGYPPDAELARRAGAARRQRTLEDPG
jgi:tRNA pseudouridine38-40 synthase